MVKLLKKPGEVKRTKDPLFASVIVLDVLADVVSCNSEDNRIVGFVQESKKGPRDHRSMNTWPRVEEI